MTYLHPLYRAAACLALCAATAAQAADPPRAPADPADPSAAVPGTRYRALLPYRSLPQQANSADQNWQSLNRTVGEINSMSLTMGGADAEPAPENTEHKIGTASASAPVATAHHHHHEGTKQ